MSQTIDSTPTITNTSPVDCESLTDELLFKMDLNNNMPKLINDTTFTKQQCPVANNQATSIKVRNMESNRELSDQLFSNAKTSVCPFTHCNGSIMDQSVADTNRTQSQVLEQAVDFLKQYYAQLKGSKPIDLCNRVRQVQDELLKTNSIEYTYDELTFASKTAWRNAVRCIGRIQWNRLHVFDRRKVTTNKQMFEAICEHIAYATNGGNIRSTITLFPARKAGRADFRVWNTQLINYAGYQQEDGTVLGDSSSVEFTKVCLRLGWNKPKANRTRFDILPIIVNTPDEKPQLFELPEHLVLRVPIEHPTCPAIAELGLEWYGLPAVSSMQLDAGGLQFTAAPFNGWYMSTEIAVRDLLDANRYNQLENLAVALNLNPKAPGWHWKDQVAIEMNIAVMHSFGKRGVTIVDQHTASDQFIQHMQNEYRQRGGCPADWVWINPPISGSLTKVFHQEMINYKLKPSYEYQERAWRTYQFESKVKLRTHFRSAVHALQWALHCGRQMRSRRPHIRVLFATETGKSEEFAERFVESMKHSVDCKATTMNEYDFDHLAKETHLIVICSTFGEGQPPENGESFSKHLDELVEKEAKLPNLRYCVLALGSSQYEHFAAFGKSIDNRLSVLGAKALLPVQCADDLKGQEEIYASWSNSAANNVCQDIGIEQKTNNSNAFDMNNVRLIPIQLEDKQSETVEEVNQLLSKQHRKQLICCKTKQISLLQPQDYAKQTVLAKFQNKNSQLDYQPGDHMAVFPSNSANLLSQIVSKLYIQENSTQQLPDFTFNELEASESQSTGLRSEVAENLHHLRTLPESLLTSNLKFKLQRLQESSGWTDHERLPAATLNTWLSHFIDFTAPPSTRLLSLLLPYVSNNKEAQRLQQLISCKQTYVEWRTFDKPSFVDLFQHFPSLKLSIEFVLTHLPIIQARFYSISSSNNFTKDEVHLTVSLAEHATKEGKGEKRSGLCSGFIASLRSEQYIHCYVRSAPSFHLPTNPHQPIILICAGSGIAPFRSFWMQRQHEIECGRGPLAKMFLFFGCRQSKLDVLFGNELPQLLNQGALHDVFYAYSRDKQHKKRYVQDQVYKQRALLLWLIEKEKGHVYVCGSAAMANGVRNSFNNMLQTEKGLSEEQAQTYFHKWIEDGHYHEDVFTSMHSYDVASLH